MGRPKVFISYSHSDADRKMWVREFADSLEEGGLSVWLDQFEIHPGDSIVEAIEEGLRGSDILVWVVDPKSTDRPNLYFELGAALAMGKRVVAVVPENHDLGRLPRPLLIRRAILQSSPEETAQALAKDLAAAED